MLRTTAVILPLLLALSTLLAFGLVGCSINPATGKRELNLVSESQEMQIGRQNDEAITAQMGLYDDQALQDYVQGRLY